MIKPPLSIIPGVGVMTDTFDFVKNLWGTMNMPGVNMPGMAVPTLSVEELEKKISDLKAVESWLNVNMSMLRGTIQALEVQRGTIMTLKSVGASLSAAVKLSPGEANEKSLLESVPYASAFLFPHVEKEEDAEADADAAGDAATDDSATESSTALNNPLAWWNILQDQFKHAVSTAAVTDTMAKLGAAGTAMATDAVVKIGEAAVKSNFAAKTPTPETKSASLKKNRSNDASNKSKEGKKETTSRKRKTAE
jgi:hypothetical protein